MIPYQNPLETAEERAALDKFKASHPEFFQKDETKLFTHLGTVGALLLFFTALSIDSSSLLFKILCGPVIGFFWFCLINVTIHHHQTHKNAAESPFAKKLLDTIFLIAVPNAPKRRSRYTRAHLNHHLRPFHETDVDHHYGTRLYLEKMKRFKDAALYFLELTFVGAHVPGWQDDKYMNEIPLEQWNQTDYQAVKLKEKEEAVKVAVLQWGGFLAAAWLLPALGIGKHILPALAWGWAYPMLLVKNWSHFLGQFQHYGEELLREEASINRRTKSFHVPGWLNWLTGGEISGHFLHHLYPEMPYYHVEEARQVFVQDPGLRTAFALY